MKLVFWAVRNKDNTLYLYKSKPIKGLIWWCSPDDDYLELDSELFPEVKWENNEPTEVELTIKK